MTSTKYTELTFSFELIDSTNKRFDFDNVRALKEFSQTELDAWAKFKNTAAPNNISPQFDITNQFQIIISNIDTWESKTSEYDQASFNQVVQQLGKRVKSHLQTHWVWHGHPYVPGYTQCAKKYSIQAAQSYLEVVRGRNPGNMNDFNILMGAISGYEFVNQDSEINRRSKSEKISLGQLSSRLQKETGSLITEVDEFKSQFNQWETDIKQKWDQLVIERDNQHDTLLKDLVNNFNEDKAVRDAKITDLEATYEEKLRLKKPAEYWSKTAESLFVRGVVWSMLLLAAIFVGLVYFKGIFDAWSSAKQIGISLDTVHGIIIFGSVLALYAYLIKVLSKFSFSSFHLMQDAKEREQLTYLYLSLINESAIDDKSREIVLQALFSRSETGLLQSESGPTMPGLHDVLSMASRSR